MTMKFGVMVTQGLEPLGRCEKDLLNMKMQVYKN